MNKNSLQERDNSLPTNDYAPLLKEMVSILKKGEQLFCVENNNLHIDICNVATRITTHLQKTKFNDVAPFAYIRGTTFSSVNFTDSSTFRDFRTQLEHLKTQLTHQLEQTLQTQKSGVSISDFVRSLIAPATKFAANKPYGLSFPFTDEEKLSKRRLHLQVGTKHTGADARLRGHKLTIRVENINAFNSQLVDGFCQSGSLLPQNYPYSCRCTPL